jgi:hypothetical protein
MRSGSGTSQRTSGGSISGQFIFCENLYCTVYSIGIKCDATSVADTGLVGSGRIRVRIQTFRIGFSSGSEANN